jgi:plasmid stabilization system protein ParE
MSETPKFQLHPAAAEDVTEIWQFIADDDPVAAGHFREEILEAIRKLVKFPHMGHKRPDLSSRPLRFHVVRDYLIAYAPDEKPLLVVAVIYGRRNPRIMAAALRARK